MRNLVLMIVLINLLAWIYQRWIIEPDEQVAATHVEQDYPRLTAYRQPARAPQPATPDESAGDKIVESETKCLKIGPISDESDADRLAASLRERGLDVAASSAEGQIWVGHWVQVVDQASRGAAEDARAALVRAGLRDAYILSGGDELKISLGVFKSSASADETIRRARALGYTTRMDERYQPGTQYWLRVAMPADRGFRPGELRSAGGQILRTEVVVCESEPPV